MVIAQHELSKELTRFLGKSEVKGGFVQIVPNTLQHTSKPLKILHVINGEYYAGAERVQDLLAKELRPLGYEVGFACLKPDKFPKACQYKSAPLHLLPMRFFFDLSVIAKLIRLIKKENYVLIHTHYPRSDLVGAIAAMMTHIPLVVHVHSQTMTDSGGFCKPRMNTFLEYLCLQKAQKALFVSRKLLKNFPVGGKIAKKAEVVHNGVPIVGERLTCRSLHTSTPVIGMVAFWRPGKGLSVALEALRELQHKKKDFRVRVVGGFVSESYHLRFKKMADHYHLTSRITWVGSTSHVNAELEKMDIFVLPSLNEGLPMVILEAMASGVPVVASNVGGIPEAIRDGIDGILVPAGEPKLLANALGDLIDNGRQWQTFRHNAHVRQRSLFSEGKMAQSVAQIYHQLLAAKKKDAS